MLEILKSQDLLFYYLVIGICYALINQYVRKLNTGDTDGFGAFWALAWPICFIVLFIAKVLIPIYTYISSYYKNVVSFLKDKI